MTIEENARQGRYWKWASAFDKIAKVGYPKPTSPMACMCNGCVGYRQWLIGRPEDLPGGIRFAIAQMAEPTVK